MSSLKWSRESNRLRLFILLLTSSVILSLMSVPGSSAAEETVTLGYQGPLTGPEAEIGIDQLNGVKYAVDIFNQKFEGKIKVTLKSIDDQGDPSVAGPVAEVASKDNNLLGIVGPAYSGATLASLTFYKSAGIPLISPSATRIALTDPTQGSLGFPIFHRLAMTDKTQGPALYKIATSGVTGARTFVVDDGSAYTVGLLQYMKDSGALFVGQESVSDNRTDWTSVITKVKSSRADVVIYLGYFNQASTFFKQVRESGYTGILAAPDGALVTELVTQNSASVINGVRVTSSTVPVGYISPSLDMEFRRKFGRAAGTFSLESLDAANVMLFCVAKGVRTRSQMLECIDGYSANSLSGKSISFDSQGDLRNSDWYEFRALKEAIGTFPFDLISKVNRYTSLNATHDAFPWTSLISGQTTNTSTSNFGYFGYTWTTDETLTFEFSPPLVTGTIREYQIGAQYSQQPCIKNESNNSLNCSSYSSLEVLKSISPSSTTSIGDMTLRSSSGSSRSYKNVQKFSLNANELRSFLNSRTSGTNRGLVLGIRALYSSTLTEWSELNFIDPRKIWGSSYKDEAATPTPTPAATTSCTAANSIGTASLSRVAI